MQSSKHYEVTLDRDATSFLGLSLTHNSDGMVTITQPKLLLKLFALYPPRKDSTHRPSHPYPPLPKESDSLPQPADHYAYLRLLGILLYLTKSRPDIMAAVSFAGTKSSSPTDRDLSDLYYVVAYLRTTQDSGHILHKSIISALRLYCEVDASYLLHPDSKGTPATTSTSTGPLALFTTAVSSRQRSPPPPLTRRTPFLLWPRNSIFLSRCARNCTFPSNYHPSSWRTIVQL